MPTALKAKRKMLECPLLPAQGTFYELGSGWGNIAFPLAKKFPNLSVCGYETSLVPYMFTRLRLAIGSYPNLKIYRADFFTIPLNKSSGIYCYLYPGAMQKLKLKFEQELPADCIVITNTFAVPGWKPDKVIEIHDIYQSKMYVYRKPL